jgi:hypothetical protein
MESSTSAEMKNSEKQRTSNRAILRKQDQESHPELKAQLAEKQLERERLEAEKERILAGTPRYRQCQGQQSRAESDATILALVEAARSSRTAA